MTDKEKLTAIKAEIERTMNWEKEQAAHSYGNVRLLHECREDMCKKFLSFIDSTQEKSINNGLDLGCGVIWKDEEPVSDDLNNAAKEYANNITEKIGYRLQLRRAVCFGANWQKQQMMKDAAAGEITYGKSLAIPSLAYRLDRDGLDFGDKVKVLIIKED